MKKTKLLALTLVVAIMMVGAGYAAWTDVIVHNTSIDTGEFDITFTRKYAKANVQFNSDAMKALDLEDNFKADPSSYADSNKTVNFAFAKAYPGTSMQTSTTATNNGTIPAVIQNVTAEVVIKDENGTVITDSKLLDAMVIDYVYYFLEDGDAVQQARKTINGSTTLGNLDAELKAKLIGEYLEPGEELTNGPEEEAAYKLVWKIPADSLVGDEAENESVEVSITYDFVQHNIYQ